MKPARGDGFCPRNVSLEMFRGENRPPRAVPRHLQDTHVTEGPEGDRLGLWAVSLGVSRAMHVMERPKGKAPASGKSPLGCSSSHVPRDAPGGECSDSPRFSLGRCRGVGRLPRVLPCHLAGAPAARSPEGDGFCPRNVSLGPPRGENRPPRAVSCHLLPATCHLPPATCHPVAAISSQANSPDRNANLGAQGAELCDSDKSVFPNLLRPVQRGRQRSW